MDYTSLKERMEKSIGAYTEKLAEIRAGRANPAILNKVKIDYYGTPTPINQYARFGRHRNALRREGRVRLAVHQ